MRGTNIFDSCSGLYGRCLTQRGAWSLKLSEADDTDLLPHYGNIALVAAKGVKRNGCYLLAMLQHWKGDLYNPSILKEVIQYLVDHQDPLSLTFVDANPGIAFYPERAVKSLGFPAVTKKFLYETWITQEMEFAMDSPNQALIAQTSYQATPSGWEPRTIPHFVYCYASVGDILLVDDPWRSDLHNAEMLIDSVTVREKTLKALPIGLVSTLRVLDNLPSRVEWLRNIS